MASRLVLVDDTDPNIQYSDSWALAQNTQLSTGTNGPPYQNTLHGTAANHSSFSYSFNGTQITVLGSSITTNTSATNNTSATQDPTWECFVDNISIGWHISAGTRTENNWVLCQSDLKDGHHVLTTNVTILHQQPFWFDQIQYLPSSGVAPANSSVRVDSSDSAIRYSSGWGEYSGIVNLTQTAGSTVTFDFLGSSVTWVGLVPPKIPSTPGSATYSIDGQTPTFFSVPGSFYAIPFYNQVFFKTKTLSYGRHQIVVTYQGNSGVAPLALDNFIVQGAPSNLDSKKPSLTGIIVGVVGGVLVFALLLLLYIRRRNNRRARELKENPKPDPFTLSPRAYTPEVMSLTSRPSKMSQNRELVANGHGTNTSDVLLSRTPRSFSSTNSQSREPAANAPGTNISEVLSRTFSSKTTQSRISATNAPGPSGYHDSTSPTVTEATSSSSNRNTEFIQPSTSPQSDNSDDPILQHEDSGVRLPRELPPAYQAVEVGSPPTTVADNQTRQ